MAGIREGRLRLWLASEPESVSSDTTSRYCLWETGRTGRHPAKSTSAEQVAHLLGFVADSHRAGVRSMRAWQCKSREKTASSKPALPFLLLNLPRKAYLIHCGGLSFLC